MSNKYKTIKHTKSEDGQIHTITLNRAKKLNAISFEMLAEIEKCILGDINPTSSKARVVIFDAEGKHFTSGLDMVSAATLGNLESGEELQEGEEEDEKDFSRKGI